MKIRVSLFLINVLYQSMWGNAQLNILLCVCALRSVVHGQIKHSTNVPLTLTGKPNPLKSRSHIKCPL